MDANEHVKNAAKTHTTQSKTCRWITLVATGSTQSQGSVLSKTLSNPIGEG